MAEDFLHRWARRKTAARSKGGAEPAKPLPVSPGPGAAPAPPLEGAIPATEPEPPLPPVESLTPDSDFSGFMRGDVDPGLRRAALKTLFSDERFNVMDGMDVYIDDYSKPDPIPAEWMGKLEQLARLGHEPDPKPAAEALPPGPLQAEPDMNRPAESSSGVEAAQAPEGDKPLDSEGELARPPDTPG